MQAADTPSIARGWRPGLLGDVVALQARYYAKEWGFSTFFEAKLARGMAEFARRYDPGQDLILSVVDSARTAGSVTIDGSDPAAPEHLLHLRWFIVNDSLRARGVGRALLHAGLEFARATGRPGIYLWTFAGLDAARRLYDAAGFQLVEEHVGNTWGTQVTEQQFVLALR